MAYHLRYPLTHMGELLPAQGLRPVVLCKLERFPSRVQSISYLAALLLGTVISCLLIFDRRLGFHAGEDIFAFGVFPFVIWGAIRFGMAGAAAVSFLISAAAVWGTAHGFGPFAKSGSLQNAALLQSFLAVISVSGITLASVISERAELIREKRHASAWKPSTLPPKKWRSRGRYRSSYCRRRPRCSPPSTMPGPASRLVPWVETTTVTSPALRV